MTKLKLSKPDVEILYKALDKLPEKMKTTVIMYEISGLSLEEIREIQGGTLSGVKSRLVRGRTMLKEILTEKAEIDNKSNVDYQFHKNGNAVYAENKTIEAGVL